MYAATYVRTKYDSDILSLVHTMDTKPPLIAQPEGISLLFQNKNESRKTLKRFWRKKFSLIIIFKFLL